MDKQSKIQNLKSKIAIVGAGPAGASLAIRLAESDFEVVLIEREKYPRQKLCGEFISPECLAHFRELGVLDEMLAAGGERVTETVFYAPSGKSVAVPSSWFGDPAGALSLSRAEMDLRLLEKAKNAGVRVLEETQTTGLLFENENVCGVAAKTKANETFEIAADLTVDATGRANVLGKLAEKAERRAEKFQISNRKPKTENPKPKTQNSKLVGFKAHLENADLPKGRCEIYFFRGGYGGLSHVENGLANHCFLVDAETVKKYIGQTNLLVEEVIFENRRARRAMQEARAVHDWLAVAVDRFGVKNLNPARSLYAVGDAAAFIDPFTGSGMLMALESAEILARVIADCRLARDEIATSYSSLYAARFARRLRFCGLMRRAAFMPRLAGGLISALSLSRTAREFLARSTREPHARRKGAS